MICLAWITNAAPIHLPGYFTSIVTYSPDPPEETLKSIVATNYKHPLVHIVQNEWTNPFSPIELIFGEKLRLWLFNSLSFNQLALTAAGFDNVIVIATDRTLSPLNQSLALNVNEAL
ncbi:hypothetical protein ACIN5180_1260 [Acinetobacter baumannii OIFC180]|nr:hypothetical protein ACIN5180_1260 [Acinetobacter baumannii OIFC180]